METFHIRNLNKFLVRAQSEDSNCTSWWRMLVCTLVTLKVKTSLVSSIVLPVVIPCYEEHAVWISSTFSLHCRIHTSVCLLWEYLVFAYQSSPPSCFYLTKCVYSHRLNSECTLNLLIK